MNREDAMGAKRGENGGMAGTSQRRAVATVTELPPGQRKIVTIGDMSIGVFNVGGRFVAYLNVCPHELAPVCLGHIRGTTLPSPPGEWRWGREGEILACPWHGWEFDLLTGVAIFGNRPRLRSFPVSVEGETIYLSGDFGD